MTEPRHDTIPLFLMADNCEHAEPPEDTPEWEEWDSDHQYGREGERLCVFSPLGRTACPACTEVAADEEDLPVGEYVACRLTTASPSPSPSGAATTQGAQQP